MQVYRLCSVVFLSGAVVMALELTGSRIIAPYLGTSLFVWTSLIGVILGALSLGYLLGGRLADKRPEIELLSAILLASSAAVALISPLHYTVLGILSAYTLDLRIGALTATIIFFAAPGVLLGMVLPCAVRLNVTSVDSSGRTVGLLYAVSTLGSICGTFATGFILISYIGTSRMILLLSAILLVSSFLANVRHRLPVKLALLLMLVLFYYFDAQTRERLEQWGILDLDTSYYRAKIITEESSSPPKRTVRSLVTDPLGKQSIMYLDSPTELAGRYAKYLLLAFHFSPSPKQVLVLGGGAYTIPKYLSANYPELTIDVVEIDPGITDIARKYFSLKDSPQLRIFHEDARNYLRKCSKNYDIVFIDVFQSSPSVPFHLTTKEAFSAVSRVLNENGIVLMNVVGSLDGPLDGFFKALCRTFRTAFPHLHAFAVDDPGADEEIQNIILAAFRKTPEVSFQSPDSMLQDLFEHQRKLVDSKASGLIFTDDFAPVERLMLPVFLEWFSELEA